MDESGFLIGLKVRIKDGQRPAGWDSILDADELETLPYYDVPYAINDTYISGNPLSVELVGPAGRGWWYWSEDIERA